MNCSTRLFHFARIPALVVLLGLMVSGCGVNTIPTAEENAKAAWSEVLNQINRTDPDPQPGRDGQGLCGPRERQALDAVVEARAKATQITR